jgi:hypothetical protein
VLWSGRPGRPTGHEFVASGGQPPDEVREAPIVGVAAGLGAQHGDSVVGDLVPCHRQSGCLLSGNQARGRYVEVRSYSQSGEPVGKQLGKQRA